MLTIDVEPRELYDSSTNTFYTFTGGKLELEHSLLSVSKWEAKWKKPFLSQAQKSAEETLDYIRCMTINRVSDQNIYLSLSTQNLAKINDYINDPMTATTITDRRPQKRDNHVTTSEEIYHAMIVNNIPFECQKWHFGRLLTLIRICAIRSGDQPKMSRREAAMSNAALNAQRRARMHSKG